MKKSKILKIFIIIAIALYCIFNTLYFANGYNWKGGIGQFDNANAGTAGTSVKNVVGAIVAIMRIVGSGVAIIMIIAVAIKYMSAAPGERADIKKHAVPFVVGAIILFASSNILGILADFASGNIK